MITTIIQGGKTAGMQLMDDALMDLVEKKRISPHEAFLKAHNKARFEAMVKDEGGRGRPEIPLLLSGFQGDFVQRTTTRFAEGGTGPYGLSSRQVMSSSALQPD